MGKFSTPDKVLYLCTGSKCAKRGGKDLYKYLKSYVKHMPGNQLEVIRIECTDRCDWAPVCNLQPANVWLKEYKLKQVLQLVEEDLQPNGNN